MAKVGRMAVVVTAGTSGLNRGLRRAETSIDRFARAGGKASKWLGGKFRPGLNAAGHGLAAFGAAATASGIGAALAIKQGADRIDDLADSSKRLLGNDGATGALAGLRFAAEEAGVEAGLLDKGMGKLLDTISAAKQGEKGAVKALRQIGLEAKTLAALRPEERMIAVADALGKVQDAGDKIGFARDIFGKSGEGMIGLFNEGGEAIRAATRDLELFGHAVSALDAEKVGTMNDEIGRLKLAWEGVTMQLAVQFAPLVSDVSGRLLGMVENAGGVGSAVDHAFRAGIDIAGSFLDKLEQVELGWLNMKKTAQSAIASAAEWVMKISDDGGKTAAYAAEQELERRAQMIPEHRREEFKRIARERGGFEDERANTTKNFAAGFREEADENQKRIDEINSRIDTKGTLGERFKAWEQTAQAKGAENAAAKLAEASEKRLDAEESITKELKEQKKTAGEGKFALLSFAGVPADTGGDAIAAAAGKAPGGGGAMESAVKDDPIAKRERQSEMGGRAGEMVNLLQQIATNTRSQNVSLA